MIFFSVIPPARSNPQRYTKMCVIIILISPHNSAGKVIIMWCKIIKFSPAPDDTFALSELELFQIDRFARSYGNQKLLRCRDTSECVQKLISPCITSIACNKKVSPHTRRGLFEE